MISGTTGLIGLLGQPVRHSLSPVMQNAALEAMGLDWRYLALPCAESDLECVLTGLRAVNCRGLNVTIPHKQAVAVLLHGSKCSGLALQAVNTLIPTDKGGWHGHNTDVEGFLAPLQTAAEAWHNSTRSCWAAAAVPVPWWQGFSNFPWMPFTSPDDGMQPSPS